jgi:hypothetical protein
MSALLAEEGASLAPLASNDRCCGTRQPGQSLSFQTPPVPWLVDVSLRAEGDFDLWIRFFRHAAHYSVDALIGGYRSHENALSSDDIDRYNRVCDDIIERELEVVPWGKPLKLFRKMDRAVKPIRGVRALWYWTAEKALYRILARNASPIIQYQRDRWVLRP